MVNMGRNTFESMNSDLLMGDLIVLYQVSQIILTTKIISRRSSFFPDISTLIDYSEEFHKSYQNMFICGGESIYKYFIDNKCLIQ